jgi:hypothetical protein
MKILPQSSLRFKSSPRSYAPILAVCTLEARMADVCECSTSESFHSTGGTVWTNGKVISTNGMAAETNLSHDP